MAGTGDLLGQLIGAALGSGSVRGGGAQQGGGGLPGGLGDILGQVLGGGAGGSGAGGGAQGGGGLPGGLGDILGQVLGGGGQRGGSGGAPSGLPGGLGDILGQVLGGGRGAPQGGPSGGAAGGSSGGLEDILGQILGGGAGGPSGGSTQGGGMSGGAGGGLGDLASEALGRGGSSTAGGYSQPEPVPPSDYRQPQPSPQPGHQPSSSGGSDLMRYGGLAIMGMLAWKAYRKWQAGAGGRAAFTSGTPDAAFSPAAAPGGPEAFSGVLLSAMAAAAQADGEIDEEEVSRIGGGLERMGAGSPQRDALIAILTTPVDPNEVVAAATTPEAALQIYAASALAIRPDNDAEHAYLDWLAGALGIEPGLKAQIEGELNA
ncbi:DUF533 domain-containing protein [Xanthobacter aminoxidans]|uniref:tellurite resistance TerB family protein n=1 Tax=Xanthobacter aminoxidans TaxID=186280 RepID=UPI0037293C08